jgi:hypothetical protein
MNIFSSPYLKKAFIISLLLESILGLLWIWLSLGEGHSGFTLGIAFHFPSSLLGVFIGESLRDFGVHFSLILCYTLSIISQLIIFTLLFQFILKKRDKAKTIS